MEDGVRGGRGLGQHQASTGNHVHHQGWKKSDQDNVPGDQPETGRNEGTGGEASRVPTNKPGGRPAKICHLGRPTGHPPRVPGECSRGNRNNKTAKGGHPNKSGLLPFGEKAGRLHQDPTLWDPSHPTLRQRPSSMFPVPQVESHRETLQVPSPVLQLRQARTERCGPPLCVLPEAKGAEVHQLQRHTYGSLQGVPRQEGGSGEYTAKAGSPTPPKTNTHNTGPLGSKYHSTLTTKNTPAPQNAGTTIGSRLPEIAHTDKICSDNTDTNNTNTNNTDTNNTDTNNTDRHHHSHTNGHTRPHAITNANDENCPGSDPESARPPGGKGGKGPKQGPERPEFDPGSGLDPGSGAEFCQKNKQKNRNQTNKNNKTTNIHGQTGSDKQKNRNQTNKNNKTINSNGQTGSDLTIISWNIQGFKSNKNLLIAAIENKEPDIILLQETFTRTKYSIKIPGYTIYHSPRTINSGTVSQGLITAIHNNIPHNTSPLIYSSSDWQSITIELTGFKNGPLKVINTYVSPTHLYDIQHATNTYKHYLISGDLNANTATWGSKNTKPGLHLQQQISDCDAILLNDPKVPTSTYGSTLDLAIASPEVAAIADWSQLEALTSDHIATVIKLSDAFTNVPDNPRPPKWDTNKANWKQFADRLHELSAVVSDNHLSLDDLLDKLTDDINEAATAAIPIVIQNCPRRPRSFLTPGARKWTKEVSKLTKIFKSHPTDQNRAELRAAQRETRQRLYQIKQDEFDSWCKQLGDMGSAQIWREIKKIRGKSSQPKSINPKEEANKSAHHFATRADHETLPEEVKSALEKQQPSRLQTINIAKSEQSDTDTPFTLHELEIVLSTPKNSAPGEDQLTYIFYSKSPPSFKLRLLNFFNQSFREGQTPKLWKSSIVVPIPKPGGRGHRPISLLPTILKIMERLILSRLIFKLPRPKNLFGFTKGRSTVDPILHLVNLITNRRKKNRTRPVYTAFLDLDKAFERADHTVILDSLISLGIKGRIISWVEDFLDNRTIKVTFQGVKSDSHPLTTGSPQGSALSPTLFNSLITTLISVSLPTCVDILAYADDIAIISYGSTPAKKLQTALNSTATKANDLGLFFSPAKTKIMAFNAKSKQHSTFHIGKQNIETVSHYRYLGVIIDNRLNFIKQALQTKQKIYSRLNMIKLISGVKVGIKTKNLITLYKSLIQSILLYAAPIYLLACTTAIKHLEIAQRTALKYVLGLPPSAPSDLISRESGIPAILQLIRGDTAKYIVRTATKPDPVQIACKTQEILNKDPRVHIQKSWAMKAAAIQRDIGIPTIHPPKSNETAPWRDIPLTIIIENKTRKTQDPQGAFTEASDRISSLNRHRAAINIYTDASLHQDGKSAWACFVEGIPDNPCGRLPNHTPVTLAELHAIHAALAWREAQDIHSDTIIHSDSMAAIKILAQTKARTYPEITTKIINSVFALNQRGSLTTLHWVPSHTNIEGNERADILANEATNLTNILHAEQTSGAYKHMITKFLHRPNTDQANPNSWYNNTIVPGIHLINNRLVDIHIRRIRCWVYTEHFFGINTKALCVHCNQNFDPVHYLINCPAFPACRQTLKQLLTPAQHNLTDTEKAAIIIRQVTINPHIILPLLKKDPYIFQNPNAH